MTREEAIVSVPLRGLWFLSSRGVVLYEKLFKRSFRPLAGIMVLIVTTMDWLEELYPIMFPSPCGDYGSYRI